MDYFNELLESYSKLKKRTFKLTFINEQEEGQQTPNDVLQKATQLAKDAINSAQPVDKDQAAPVNNVMQEPTNYKIYKNIDTSNVNVIGLGDQGGELTVKDKNGTIVTDAFNKFVQVLAKGQTPEQKSIADQEQAKIDQAMAEQQELEALEQKLLTSVGGSYVMKRRNQIFKEARARGDRSISEKVAMKMAEEELKQMEYVPIGGKTAVESYKRQLRYAYLYQKELLAQYPDGKLPEGLKKGLTNFIKNPTLILVGSSSGSFEEILTRTGAGFSIDDKGNKIITDLDPEAIQDAVLANEFLLSFLDTSDDDPYKCDQIRKKIGVQKTGDTRQFVLFGPESGADGTPTGGVVLTANKLQERALDAAAKQCPEQAKNLDAIINGKFHGNNKNAIKGSIYEVVPRITVLRNKLMANPDDKATKELLKKVIYEVLQEEKLPILEEIAAQSGALSLDAYIEQQEAVEQLNIISSKKNLAAWLLTEAKIMNSFISKLPHAPDDVLHVALSPKQGDRPDNSFIYTNLEEAQKSAEFSHGEVSTYTKSQILELVPKTKKDQVEEQLKNFTDDQEIHLVNIAQKRMVAHGEAKAGEVSRQNLMRGYVLGQDPTNSAADGYLDAINELVELTDSRKNYFKSVEDYAENAVAPFKNPTIYTHKGGLKIQKQEDIAKIVANKLKGQFTQKQIQDLNLTQLFFDGDKPRNFEDPIVQKRIAEGLERNIRMARYKKDLKEATGKKKKDIEAVLIRQALVCGYTKTDMAQVKGTDDGTLRVWSHNEPLRQVVEDWNNGNLNISVEGLQVSFTGTGKTGEPMTYVKFSQEGTKTGSGDSFRRDTRSQTKFTKEAQDEFNILKEAKN